MRTPLLRLTAPADRVEVDLDLQVLHVVEDGQVVRTMPVSSGNGETYRQRDGSTARALTPVGTYRIERRIVGVREAPLGTLYDPQYSFRGWAIHGSSSVPAGPASHGCVRVTRADATALLRLLEVGTTVHLHGGEHVFSAGSRAAGTSTPAGDTGEPPATSPSAPALSPTPSSTAPASPAAPPTPSSTSAPAVTTSPSAPPPPSPAA